ncbi:MAG: hypothetical protein QXD05_01775 [Candidatus Pacearchaeota archaeon]
MKKGQVGTTLTWFLAFIIIIGILIIFLFLTSIMSLKKETPTISLMEISGDLEAQNRLFYLLNLETSEGKRFIEEIYSWKANGKIENEDKIKNFVREALFYDNERCYFFRIDNKIFFDKGFSSKSSYLFESQELREAIKGDIVNSAKINLYFKGDKIKIEFKSKAC